MSCRRNNMQRLRDLRRLRGLESLEPLVTPTVMSAIELTQRQEKRRLGKTAKGLERL